MRSFNFIFYIDTSCVCTRLKYLDLMEERLAQELRFHTQILLLFIFPLKLTNSMLQPPLLGKVVKLLLMIIKNEHKNGGQHLLGYTLSSVGSQCCPPHISAAWSRLWRVSLYLKLESQVKWSINLFLWDQVHRVDSIAYGLKSVRLELQVQPSQLHVVLSYWMHSIGHFLKTANVKTNSQSCHCYGNWNNQA